MNVCIFGDSITEGYYDKERGGWVTRLALSLTDDKVHNLGVSGDTTIDLLERFDMDITDKRPDLIVFFIGINDSIFIPGENRNYVGFDNFKGNLGKLTEKAKQFSEEIVFIGLIPVDERLVAPMPWQLQYHYLNSEIKKYDQAIKKACDAEKIRFIELYRPMEKVDYKKFLNDGIHPNEKGHQWIADKVLKGLNSTQFYENNS